MLASIRRKQKVLKTHFLKGTNSQKSSLKKYAKKSSNILTLAKS